MDENEDIYRARIACFLTWADSINVPDSLVVDPIRGGTRPEILAAIVCSSTETGTHAWLEEQCVKKLCELQNSDHLWAEAPYGIEDEKIGVSGTVTSAWVILALIARYRNSASTSLLETIIAGADALYQRENRGDVKKGGINRGSVLNTNLLAAVTLCETAKILPPTSRRGELFRESTRRIVRKVIGFQLTDGSFPYHFDTHRVSILYQAMVCALLKALNVELKNSAVARALGRGTQKLTNFFNDDGSIDWTMANLNDKNGAVWTYTFALAVLPENKCLSVSKHTRSLISGDLFVTGDNATTAGDPFYTAWGIFGILWALRLPKCQDSGIRTSADYLLLLEYYVRRLGFVIAFGIGWLDKKLFGLGSAIENKRWRA